MGKRKKKKSERASENKISSHFERMKEGKQIFFFLSLSLLLL